MNYGGAITKDIGGLLDLLPRIAKIGRRLTGFAAVADRGKWDKAHGVFNQIRSKSAKAGRSGKPTAMAQYLFEEVCAKTLYNLSGNSAPFDADSPYWVVPNAIAFARLVGVKEQEVLSRITSPIKSIRDLQLSGSGRSDHDV
jgi:hypothetical protein